MRYLIIFFFLFSTTSFAGEYYVFINKQNHPDPDVSQRGDIVNIVPATQQYEPTPGELASFMVIKVDMTEQEFRSAVNVLSEPAVVDEQIEYEGKTFTGKKLLKSRRKFVDIDVLRKNQKEKVSLNEIYTNVKDRLTVSGSDSTTEQ